MALHSALTGSELHEPKGAAAASSGQVYVANGAGSGTWTTLDAGTPSNVVRVETVADFPAAVSDVITLAADTAYQIVGAVSIGDDRIVFNTNNILYGTNSNLDSITSTTSSPLITSNNANAVLRNLSLSSTGDILDFDAANDHNLTLDSVTFSSSASYGNINGAKRCRIVSSIFDTTTTDGFVFAGTCTELNIQRANFANFVGTALDLTTSTWDSVVIRNTEVVTDAGTTGLVAAASSANINSGRFGYINECVFDDTTGTASSGLAPTDTRWEIRDTVGITSTVDLQAAYAGMGVYDGAAAVSTIGTTAQKLTVFDTDMPAEGAVPDSTTDSDITVNTAGDYLVGFSTSFSTAAAGDAGLYQFRLRINGSEGTGAEKLGFSREMSGSSDTGAAAFCGLVNLSASDVLTIWVESDDGGDTDDISVNDAHFWVQLLKAT